MRAPEFQPGGRVCCLPGGSVLLLAGQFYFGGKAAEVHTLLGSCVGIALWHPERRLGGLCHFLLATRQRRSRAAARLSGQGTPPGPESLDARYGDEAMTLMLRAIEASGTRPVDYHAWLYGGADTRSGRHGSVPTHIGIRNIEAAWHHLDRHGFQLEEVDVGDHVSRSVRFTLHDGRVQCRRGKLPGNAFP